MAKRKWYLEPLTKRITLPDSDGEWIEVKKRLTVGERRAMKSSLMKVTEVGHVVPNFELLEVMPSAAFIVDWSMAGANGKKFPVDTLTERLSSIDNMDPDDFDVIKAAVEAHAEAMEAERETEKNGPAGEKKSSAISPSPSE